VRNYSGLIYDGKLVFVSVMYSTKARKRWGLLPKAASHRKEETSFSRRSLTRALAGDVRMPGWNVSGLVRHQRQVGFGSSSNHEG